MAESAADFIQRKKSQLAQGPTLIRTKDALGTTKYEWERQAATFMRQSNHPEKVFVFDRLRLIAKDGPTKIGATVGDVEYRLGYYIVSRRQSWAWGQFCPFIPHRDLALLLDLAHAEGTVLGSEAS